MRHNETHQLAISWIDRSYHVLTHMSSVVGLGRTRTSFDPSLPGSGISFKSGLIPEEHLVARVIQEIPKFTCKLLPVLFPHIAIRRLRNRARDAAGIASFMEIAHQGRVAQLHVLIFAKPSAQLYGSPMILPGQSWIIKERENFFINFVSLDQTRPPWLGTIGQAVDAPFVKGFDPKLMRPLTDAGVLESDLEGATAA